MLKHESSTMHGYSKAATKGRNTRDGWKFRNCGAFQSFLKYSTASSTKCSLRKQSFLSNIYRISFTDRSGNLKPRALCIQKVNFRGLYLAESAEPSESFHKRFHKLSLRSKLAPAANSARGCLITHPPGTIAMQTCSMNEIMQSGEFKATTEREKNTKLLLQYWLMRDYRKIAIGTATHLRLAIICCQAFRLCQVAVNFTVQKFIWLLQNS